MDDDQIGNSTMLQERVEDEDFLVRRELLLFGERIIFVLDDDSEENMSEWEPGSGKSRLEAAADAIRLIIRRKLNATLKNTFAIASYNSASHVTWREGFTSDFQRLDDSLTALTALVSSSSSSSQAARKEQEQEQGGAGGVQLAEVFAQLMDVGAAESTQSEQTSSAGAKPETETDATEPRAGVLTRFLFIYSRSAEVPVYSSAHPIFPSPAGQTHFLDCLFLHHKLATHRDCAAACQDTLNVLSLIQRGDPDEEDDEGGEEENNYLFETHASNMRLMTFAALLCSHPAHREDQADMLAKFNVNDASLQSIREVDAQSRLEEVAIKAKRACNNASSNSKLNKKHASNGKQQQAAASASAGAAATTHHSPTSPPAGSSPSSPSVSASAASAPGAKNSSSSSSKNLSDVAADTVKNMFGMSFGNNRSKSNKSKGTISTSAANEKNHHGTTHDNCSDSY